MTDLDVLKAAFGRLDRAVGRLEQAAEAREHRVQGRERDLQTQLHDARIDHAKAVAVNTDLSVRLEAAIGRLESVVES